MSSVLICYLYDVTYKCFHKSPESCYYVLQIFCLLNFQQRYNLDESAPSQTISNETLMLQLRLYMFYQLRLK